MSFDQALFLSRTQTGTNSKLCLLQNNGLKYFLKDHSLAKASLNKVEYFMKNTSTASKQLKVKKWLRDSESAPFEIPHSDPMLLINYSKV